MISQAGPGHAWPGLPNGENAFHIVVFNDFATDRVQDDGVNSVHGKGAASRLHRGYTRNVGADVAAGLGLPIRINYGALLPSNLLVVPTPGLGIDWFSNGAKDAQAGEIVSLGNIVAVAHQRSDGSRGRVKVSDLVALNHIPVPA